MPTRDSRLNGPGEATAETTFGIAYPDDPQGAPPRPTQQIIKLRPTPTNYGLLPDVVGGSPYGERESTDGDSGDDWRMKGQSFAAPGRHQRFDDMSLGPFVGGGGARGF